MLGKLIRFRTAPPAHDQADDSGWAGRLRRTVAATGSMSMTAVFVILGVRAALSGRLLMACVHAMLALLAFGGVLTALNPPRPRAQVPLPVWMHVLALLAATVAVALLVEAVNLPVRFDQPGFQYVHWVIVLGTWALGYLLPVRGLQAWRGRRLAAQQRPFTPPGPA